MLLTAPLIARLERIEALAHDLAHELARAGGGETKSARAMADAIQQDIEAVLRALKKPIRY